MRIYTYNLYTGTYNCACRAIPLSSKLHSPSRKVQSTFWQNNFSFSAAVVVFIFRNGTSDIIIYGRVGCIKIVQRGCWQSRLAQPQTRKDFRLGRAEYGIICNRNGYNRAARSVPLSTILLYKGILYNI